MNRRALVLLCALPLLAGCIGKEREQLLGNRIAERVNVQVPLVADSGVSRYVQTLGVQIARASSRPELPYRFHVVNSPAVNAFALPGGHVYVNRGLLEQTENASELAAVLGHEVAHVAERHGAKMLERRLRTGSVVGLLYRVFLGNEPSLMRESALRLGDAAWSARHSRKDEMEADDLAVGYLARAGMNPAGMTSFLTGLLEEEQEDPAFFAPWFATHPMTAERLARARREISELPATPGGRPIRDVASYARFLERVRSLPAPPMLLPPGHPPIPGHP